MNAVLIVLLQAALRLLLLWIEHKQNPTAGDLRRLQRGVNLCHRIVGAGVQLGVKPDLSASLQEDLE